MSDQWIDRPSYSDIRMHTVRWYASSVTYLESVTHGQTDRQTDQQTDGQTLCGQVLARVWTGAHLYTVAHASVGTRTHVYSHAHAQMEHTFNRRC